MSGSAFSVPSPCEPHTLIGPRLSPGCERDRPRSAARVIACARRPGHRACLGKLDELARDARPLPCARIQRRTIAFPVSSCLIEANARHHQMPPRAGAHDRSTLSFKHNPFPPHPDHFGDGTIPNWMHDLRRKTNTDVHRSIPHMPSAVCTGTRISSANRMRENDTTTRTIPGYTRHEELRQVARVTAPPAAIPV